MAGRGNGGDQTGKQGKVHDHYLFFHLVSQGIAIQTAKRQAGFSPGYSVKLIERSRQGKANKQLVQLHSAPIEQARKVMNNIPGLTIADSARFNQVVRDDTGENTPDRQRSDKALRDTLGQDAPKQIQSTMDIKQTCLIMELSDVPSNLLQEVLHELPHNI